VPYAPIDPGLARDMFVEHALMAGECRVELPFRARNQQALDDVHALEQRVRRDLAITEQDLFDLYDRRVPSDIVTVEQFERWWRPQPEDVLAFTLDELTVGAKTVDPADYPETWEQGDLVFPVSYRFDATGDDDGLTVHIPLVALNRVTPVGFDWLIPGWREELVTALIRTLPKPVRRNFVPAPDFARRFLTVAHPADGPLVERLEAVLPPMTGDPIPPGSFRVDHLPPHLRATFAAHDAADRVVGQGKDLPALQRALDYMVRDAIVAALPPIERSGQRGWVFGTIPAQLESGAARGFPALVDEGETVGLRVLTGRGEQRAAMWSGTRRLVRIVTGVGRRSVARELPPASALALARAARWPAAPLLDRCIDAAVDELLSEHGGPAWDEQHFDDLVAFVSPRLQERAVRLAVQAADIVALASELSARLAATSSLSLHEAVDDMQRQLGTLVPTDFPWAPGAARLPDVMRYLRGIERRLDKLAEAPGRDAAAMRKVHALEEEQERLLERLSRPEQRAEARRLRWMLEELRLSLFAQAIGPAYRISEQRVRRAFAEVASRDGAG